MAMTSGMGLIGCGGMGGTWHATIERRTRAQQDCDLLWAFDTDKEAATRRIAGTATRVADDVQDILADDRVLAVVICTPTFTHADLVVAAAEAGKHVLVEKPMSLTLGDCRRMINACSTAGVKLVVGQTIRFWGAFLRARQLIDEGVIGTPWAAQIHRMGATSPTPVDAQDSGRLQRPWRYDTRLAGGNILEGVVHELDLTRAIFGDVQAASCIASGNLVDGDHRAPILMQAMLEFDGRRQATVRMGGLVGYDGGGNWISGTRGTLHFDQWEGPISVRGPASDAVREESCAGLGAGPVAGEQAFDRELADLLDAIRHDTDPENSGMNGMCNIGLGLALYQSIATGRRFVFEQGLPVGVDDDFQYRGPTELI